MNREILIINPWADSYTRKKNKNKSVARIDCFSSSNFRDGFLMQVLQELQGIHAHCQEKKTNLDFFLDLCLNTALQEQYES